MAGFLPRTFAGQTALFEDDSPLPTHTRRFEGALRTAHEVESMAINVDTPQDVLSALNPAAVRNKLLSHFPGIGAERTGGGTYWQTSSLTSIFAAYLSAPGEEREEGDRTHPSKKQELLLTAVFIVIAVRPPGGEPSTVADATKLDLALGVDVLVRAG